MKKYFLKSKLIFIILNFVINLYCLLILFFTKKKIFKNKKIKNAALVFDKKFFYSSKYKNSGNVILAKKFYDILKKRNIKINIFDLNDQILVNNKYDLILGLASKNYVNLCQNNEGALKILLLVNSNFLNRNLILIKKYLYYNLSIDPYEVINPIIYTKSLNFSDKVYLLGNKSILKTYNNIPKNIKSKFELINLMPSKIFLKKKIFKKKNYINVAYFFGYAGVRKGLLDFLFAYQKLFSNNKFLTNKKIKLLIFGDISPEVQNLIKKKISHPFKNIKQINFKEYLKTILTIDISMLFSQDEGQNFSIMESVFSGALPFVNVNSGLEFQRLFMINNFMDNELFRDNFLKIINLVGKKKCIIQNKKAVKTIINNASKSERNINIYFDKYIK